jgi:hypothetical protein
LGDLRDQLRTARSNIKQGEALSSHSKGFYEEIGKLAKGKILIAVTDLVVTQANDIIRDAKRLIKNDQAFGNLEDSLQRPLAPNEILPIAPGSASLMEPSGRKTH